jgi:hypothetical protein
LFDPETRAATDEEVALGFTDYEVPDRGPALPECGWRLPNKI